MPTTPYPLGRHVEHDERSRAYGVVVNPSAPPRKVMWGDPTPVLDQGQVGSCTGNALAQWLNVTGGIHGKPLTEADAVAIYTRATHLDNIAGTYPAADTGSTALAVCKAAVERGWLTAYRHAFGLTQMLAALQSGPVMLGTEWTESMFEPDAKGRVRPAGQVVGGHQYLAIGYDPATRLVTCLNSWSATWGRRGCFDIAANDLGHLLAAQGDATIPVR